MDESQFCLSFLILIIVDVFYLLLICFMCLQYETKNSKEAEKKVRSIRWYCVWFSDL